MTKTEKLLQEKNRRRALIKDALTQDGALIGLTPAQAEEKIEIYYQKMLKTINSVTSQLAMAAATGATPEKLIIKNGDKIVDVENIMEIRYPA